jgi:hypothetical protein
VSARGPPIPELNLAKQIRSLEGGEHEVNPKRNRNALRLQEAPPGVSEKLDHAGVENDVADLVGDYDIDSFRQAENYVTEPNTEATPPESPRVRLGRLDTAGVRQ